MSPPHRYGRPSKLLASATTAACAASGGSAPPAGGQVGAGAPATAAAASARCAVYAPDPNVVHGDQLSPAAYHTARAIRAFAAGSRQSPCVSRSWWTLLICQSPKSVLPSAFRCVAVGS